MHGSRLMTMSGTIVDVVADYLLEWAIVCGEVAAYLTHLP